MTAPILNLEDQRSIAWRKVCAYAEAQLKSLRAQLEQDVSPERTVKLRGQIRANVLLLALGDAPAPALEAESDED